MNKIFWVFSALLFPVIAALAAETSAPAAKAPAPLPPKKAQAAIASQARNTVKALKNKDWAAVAKLIDPRRGLCFTPYPQACDKPLSREELLSLAKAKQPRNWGSYDGSGEPIELPLTGYYDRFIYDRDFAQAPQVLYNTVETHGGDSYDPLKDHPQAIVVEFHFPNTPGKSDWSSLRLVFEKAEKPGPGKARWYLTLIQHGQWTT